MSTNRFQNIDLLTMQAAMNGNPEAVRRIFPCDVKGGEFESEVTITRFDQEGKPKESITAFASQTPVLGPDSDNALSGEILILKSNFDEDEFNRLMAECTEKNKNKSLD